MNESINFWNGITNVNGKKLTDEEKIYFCESLNGMLRTSNELAKIFFNTQAYNELVNDVTTRGLHSEGVATVAEHLARNKAKLDGTSEMEQVISGLLAKALGYMHDLGHTPFGHDGERALNYEMERFDANSDYKRKREKAFGKQYTIQAGDPEAETMCYEHNETSAIIAQEILEKFARENEYVIDKNAMQYIKTGILAHSTSRVKEEPKGLEQKAVRLADKIAYIPQDLLDLLKQNVLKIDDLNKEEQNLLGLAEKSNEIEKYEVLEDQNQEQIEDDDLIKIKLKDKLRNIDKLPYILKMKLFRSLDSRVDGMQAEIAKKCFFKDKNGEIKLDGRKSRVDFYGNAVNKGKIPKNHEITEVEMEGINLFKNLRDAQKMPANSQEEISLRKKAVDEAAMKYRKFLSEKEHINPLLASLWVTKSKYQDSFLKEEFSRVFIDKDKKIQTETLSEMNNENEKAWRMKCAFQFFYSNIDQIPDDFKNKYQQKKDLYNNQQVTSAFIASFTNDGLDKLYDGLLEKNLVVSREDAINQVQKMKPDLDVEQIVSHNKKWVDPQNPDAKYTVAANDVLEYLYEENIKSPIVAQKQNFPPIRHLIAVRDSIEKMQDKRSIKADTPMPELLKSAQDLSKKQVNSKEIQLMVSSIIDRQNSQEIQKHIDEVRKFDEEK